MFLLHKYLHLYLYTVLYQKKSFTKLQFYYQQVNRLFYVKETQRELPTVCSQVSTLYGEKKPVFYLNGASGLNIYK